MVLDTFLLRFGKLGEAIDRIFKPKVEEELMTLPFVRGDIEEVSGLLFREKGASNDKAVESGEGGKSAPAPVAPGETLVEFPVTGREIRLSRIFPEDKKPEDLVFGEDGSKLL